MSQQHFSIKSTLEGIAAACVSIASLAVVWGVVAIHTQQRATATGAAAVPPVENVEGRSITIKPNSERAKLGEGLAIIEFSDFQCPFCGRYARETFPLLKREFIDTGQVNYVFMHFPLEALHSDALNAAEAAVCAGRQDKFWDMHDRLFANQAALVLPSIMNYVRELRLDEPSFEKCLVSIGSAVQDDMEEGRRVGVTGTPTLMIGDVGPGGSVAVRRRISGFVQFGALRSTIVELRRNAGRRES